MSEAAIIRVEGRLGRISLNRPSALNALTEEMCAKMIHALLAWRADADVGAVLIDHAEGVRGFCAGGDIRMIAESARSDGRAAHAFFRTEYQLNDLIHGYEKAIIAVIDGVTMGGGVGVSVHAPYRIATERTRFAMPETGIGLFPDVGGGWFLPRLAGQMGVWLGLTGAIVNGADCLHAGIATHFVPSAALPALKAAVAADAQNGAEAWAQTLAPFCEAPDAPIAFAAEHRARMDETFAFDALEDIIAALERDGSSWARAQLSVLASKSPLMSKTTLRLLRAGLRFARFADEMRTEFRLAVRAVRLHDFQDGVRAVIIEKDRTPRWSPARLEEVTPAMVDAMFAPLAASEEWAPL